MINLKSLFKRNSFTIAVEREEVELLKFFLLHKTDFEHWYFDNQQFHPKIRFVFFFPTAIDFYYDNFKLFTAYFNKEINGDISFVQLKMSQVNYTNIKTTSWKPFKETIINYLTMVEQRNTDTMLLQQRSLHEYKLLCDGEAAAQKHASVLDTLGSKIMLTGR